MSRVGTQLIVPDGFRELESGRTYYLLKSDPSRERVLLIHFIERPQKQTTKKAQRQKQWRPVPMPCLIEMPRNEFEAGLLDKKIVPLIPQKSLPPWLAALEGENLETLDETRKSAKRSHADRIDAILGHIWPLIQRLDTILNADDPCAEINRHARACTPPQNETRLRTAFFSYVLFGRNRAALHYPVRNIGRWDRINEKYLNQKFGRPRKYKGRSYGFGTNDPSIIKKIGDGYRRFSGPGVHMNRIYRETIVRVFGCKERRDEHGRCHYYHPTGNAFPSKGQFSYRVKQEFGQDQIYLTKYGSARTRNRLRPSEGRFTESALNLMERTENDGYWCEEVVRGYLDGEPLPKLCVVRARCGTSGLLTGIGFSLGAETAAAYRMMRFCMAIDKVKFCSLFGIKIKAWQWPSQGLTPNSIDDRGPGSVSSAHGADTEYQPVIAELTQSWSGQAKAGVESSHPRSVHLEGKPMHKITHMTISQLAAREITRVIADNDSADVSGRFNPEHFIAHTNTSPLALWDYLDKRGRNDEIPMSFEDAVRAFLTKKEVSVRCDGVYLHEQRFDSPALRKTEILDRIPIVKSFKLDAYILDACVRHIWVEVGGHLIEVDAMLAIASDQRTLYMSVAELAQVEELRREAKTRHDEHRDAAISAVARDFEDTFGHPFEAEKRKSGHAKTRTPAAQQEASETKRFFGSGGRK